MIIAHLHLFCCLIGSGKYLYLETFSEEGQEAVLQSSTIEAGTPERCLFFAYHMYGEGNTGELKIESVYANGSRVLMFNNIDPGSVWRWYEITLPSQKSAYHVRKCINIINEFLGT